MTVSIRLCDRFNMIGCGVHDNSSREESRQNEKGNGTETHTHERDSIHPHHQHSWDDRDPDRVRVEAMALIKIVWDDWIELRLDNDGKERLAVVMWRTDKAAQHRITMISIWIEIMWMDVRLDPLDRTASLPCRWYCYWYWYPWMSWYNIHTHMVKGDGPSICTSSSPCGM